jgi:uncharacterized membrane protein
VRNNMLVGLFLTVPVVVTIVIFNVLFKFATNWSQGFFPHLREFWNGYLLRVLTLLSVLLVFYFIGLLTRNFLGRRLYRLGDHVLASIPLVRTIYVSIRQISQSLFTQRKTLFKEVVLVQYPRKGLYSLAFVTAAAPRRLAARLAAGHTDEPCVSLFIATTPNPTSGVFILAPRSEIIPLDIPVTDALTFIMSAGAVAPGEEEAPGKATLLDRLEEWLRHSGEPPSEPANATETTT